MKRNLVFLVVLAVLLVTVSSCNSSERLYVYNWSYYIPDSVLEQFEEEYGVRVIYDEYASNEEMFAKIMATNREGFFGRFLNLFGRRYDIVFPSEDYTAIMISQGLLEPLDHSLIPNLRHIDPLVLEKAIYDPNMIYAVPYYWGAAGVSVNTAMVPVFDRDWNIFSRTDLQGRMTMLDDMREVIGAALAFLGYSANSTNPREINEARDLINNAWKPNLVKFDAEAFGKGFANGEFWVVHGYPEVVYEEIMDNPQLLRDFVFFIPPGGSAYIDNMVILKGSENIELAHKFIDFIHRPDIYAEFCDEFGFPATVNIPARAYKEGISLYTIEDLYDLEFKYDLGEALNLYNDAWFNSIRIGF